jgi:hypothetical protein
VFWRVGARSVLRSESARARFGYRCTLHIEPANAQVPSWLLECHRGANGQFLPAVQVDNRYLLRIDMTTLRPGKIAAQEVLE